MLLQNSFDVKSGAIGELVQTKIQEILNTLEEVDQKLRTCSCERRLSFEEICHYQSQLQRYKESTVAFLADGIIKVKLESEINQRLRNLNQQLPVQNDDRVYPFGQLDDAQLEAQLKSLTKELERRKGGLQ